MAAAGPLETASARLSAHRGENGSELPASVYKPCSHRVLHTQNSSGGLQKSESDFFQDDLGGVGGEF